MVQPSIVPEEILGQSAEERARCAHTDCWFDLPRSIDVRDEIELTLSLPKSRRPHNILLTADMGMGKTKILDSVSARYSGDRDCRSGILKQPIIHIDMPSPVDVSLLLRELLWRAGIPSGDRIYHLRERFATKVPLLDPVGILVDEAQRLALEPYSVAAKVCECLKWISAELQIPLIVAGTPEIALYFDKYPQLGRRFQYRHLPAWQLDDQFQQAVCSVMSAMPLRQGFDEEICLDETCLRALLHVSEGTTDRLFFFLRSLTSRAIREGKECIQVEDILEACKHDG